MLRTIFITLFSTILCFSHPPNSSLFSQDSTAINLDKIAAVVVLDSFIVRANRLDPKVFIRYVLEDESFYQAFKNLRRTAYTADNNIQFFAQSGKVKASYQSTTRQTYQDPCREMSILKEKTTGKFRKRGGKYRYYTAKMFDRVFFTHGKACESKQDKMERSKSKGIEKNISQLKRLIFQPGQRINVPVIGKKTAIFESHMLPYYEYAIISGKIAGVDCYIFSVDTKPEIEKKHPQKTVIKHLETYFAKGSLQVMGRNYRLSYSGLAFSFDVTMDIKLTYKNGEYLPEIVSYDGYWKVPLQKAERCRFEFSKR